MTAWKPSLLGIRGNPPLISTGPPFARLASKLFFGRLWGMIPTNQFLADFAETSSPSPLLYHRGGTRPKAPHQLHHLADLYSCLSCWLSERAASSRLENGNELCEPPIIRIACRTIPVGLDPFRMLRQQIAMQLFLQISIRSNPTPVRAQLS
jgi:hypothetical protein